MKSLIIVLLSQMIFALADGQGLPLVVSTWWNPGFKAANGAAWASLSSGSGRLAAVVAGCSSCEAAQCDGTVGYGGSPDERGETTLDALLMDGPGQRMGAVGDLRRVRDASRVAWAVMNHTRHSFLVGESATLFAQQMGFAVRNLSTSGSVQDFRKWHQSKCQPNFWRSNVNPDPRQSCGPYTPTGGLGAEFRADEEGYASSDDHDTIGMVVVDAQGDVAVGTSTNGASHKIHGRVGDSPIPGAGAYVDNEVGGAAATGDGDIMMRFLPAYQTVEFMRNGRKPGEAASLAIRRIARKYPTFVGAVVAGDRKGRYGAACHGIRTFTYAVSNPAVTGVQNHTVTCM